MKFSMILAMVFLFNPGARADGGTKQVRFMRFQCEGQRPDKSVLSFRIDQIGYEIDSESIYRNTFKSKLLIGTGNVEIDGNLLFFQREDGDLLRQDQVNDGIYLSQDGEFKPEDNPYFNPKKNHRPQEHVPPRGAEDFGSTTILMQPLIDGKVHDKALEDLIYITAQIPTPNFLDIGVVEYKYSSRYDVKAKYQSHCVLQKNLVGSRADIDRELGDSVLLGANLDRSIY